MLQEHCPSTSGGQKAIATGFKARSTPSIFLIFNLVHAVFPRRVKWVSELGRRARAEKLSSIDCGRHFASASRDIGSDSPRRDAW